VYSYGDHIRTPEEGNRIAKIKAEGLLCRKEVFHGDGSVPYMMPGYIFTLKDHYRGSFNQSYLVTDVSHEGNQTEYLLAGITMGQEDRGVFYRNSFSSIVSTVQFRPEATAQQPRIAGTLTAKIDAASSGEYAELDSQGRYAAILPFDISGKKDGKASAPIRMAQPYAGSNHGMHFPLHKGTEVLLTFIDGDPDGPIIQSAVPNPETQSPVNVNNQTMSAITTVGGNNIHIEDQAGNERILMHSPNKKSFIRVGAPNDPSVSEEYEGLSFIKGGTGIKEATDGWLDVLCGMKNEVILGILFSLVVGLRGWFTVGVLMDVVLGPLWEIQVPDFAVIKNFHANVSQDTFKAYVDKTKTGSVRRKFIGSTNRIEHRVSRFAEEQIDGAEVTTGVAVKKVDAKAQEYNEAQANFEILDRADNALAAEMKNLGTKFMGTGQNTVMIGAVMSSSGLCNEQVVDHTQKAGSALNSAGLKAISAASITQR
jgi:type VI secretion system secreted protein VgrG